MVPNSGTTTKCGLILSTTRRDGANSPHLFVCRRWQTTGMRRSSLLDLRKLARCTTVQAVFTGFSTADVELGEVLEHAGYSQQPQN